MGGGSRLEARQNWGKSRLTPFPDGFPALGRAISTHGDREHCVVRAVASKFDSSVAVMGR